MLNDEDFIERFMFESKKGDSTAFASAAVIMFRACGIPARYVVGYAAPANLFAPQSDGSYMAVLQDDNAHAWVEIYVHGVGWYPVETTPGFEGVIDNLEMPDEEEVSDAEAENIVEETEAVELEDNNTDEGNKLKIKIVICLCFLIIIRIIWVYRQTYALKRGLSPNERIRILFRNFYKLLIKKNFPETIDTTGEQFIQEVITRYPALGTEEFTRYMQLVLIVNYGNSKLEASDVELAVKMYRKLRYKRK